MNRLVLAFGTVCLLQGLLAAPRPEFGLAVTIPASDKLATVRSGVQTIKNNLDGISFAAASASGYGHFDDTLTVLSSFRDDITGLIQPILDAYDSLRAAHDGDVAGAFAPLESAISSALGYYTSLGLTGDIIGLDVDGYQNVADMLIDAGARVSSALNDLYNALSTVQADLTAAQSAASSANVPTSILNANLPLADVYQLLKLATNLKAYLPLFDYILNLVNDNINEGDLFILSIQDAIDAISTSSLSQDYQDAIDSITDDIEDTVANGLSSVYDAYVAIQSGLSGFTHLSTATGISTLSGTIGSFVSAFGVSSLVTPSANLQSADHAIGSDLDALITSLTTGQSAVDNGLVQLLVDTLVGNLEYGQYCFNKYKYLVEGLFDVGADGGWECIDKEVARLQYLEDTISLMLDLLVFDYEDIADEISVCDMISASTTDMNNCVSELNGYYTDLLTATKKKRDLIYQLAEGEAVASDNRLLICFELSYIDTSVTESNHIEDGLKLCAAGGPNAAD